MWNRGWDKEEKMPVRSRPLLLKMTRVRISRRYVCPVIKMFPLYQDKAWKVGAIPDFSGHFTIYSILSHSLQHLSICASLNTADVSLDSCLSARLMISLGTEGVSRPGILTRTFWGITKPLPISRSTCKAALFHQHLTLVQMHQLHLMLRNTSLIKGFYQAGKFQHLIYSTFEASGITTSENTLKPPRS